MYAGSTRFLRDIVQPDLQWPPERCPNVRATLRRREILYEASALFSGRLSRRRTVASAASSSGKRLYNGVG
jgi:hypothetical protein